MARVTHSLGFAVATTVLVAGGSSVAAGQSPASQTQEPSRPAISPAADEDASRDGRREPLGRVVSSLFRPGGERGDSAKPSFSVGSLLSDVEVRCIGCRGFDTPGERPPSTNVNAPWALQGKWRRETRLGVVSTGFAGVRNVAVPLSTVIPLGGDMDAAALGAFGSNAFLPGSEWSVTAGIERTLVKSANGTSFGITADVLIPVRKKTVGVGDPRTTVLSSPTTRFGGVLRW